MKLLVWYPVLTEQLREKICEAAFGRVDVCFAQTEEKALEEVIDAEILFSDQSSREVVQRGSNLLWIQPASAGMDVWIFPETVDRQILLTSAAGVFAYHVAEHAFALLLSLTRGVASSARNQMAHRWVPWQDVPVSEIAELTLGVIGLGGIGTEIAIRGNAFRMRVVATDVSPKSKPDFVSELWTNDRLDLLLQQSDVVMISAPLTSQTWHLIGERELSLMKTGAYLINVARGKIVDQPALIDSLKAGHLAGAGLDVFEEEPLPADSDLWGMPNVVITPHLAGGSQRRHERMVRFFCENLGRYTGGGPLLNVVDQTRGF